jgi:hypothetical protein
MIVTDTYTYFSCAQSLAMSRVRRDNRQARSVAAKAVITGRGGFQVEVPCRSRWVAKVL